MEYFIVVVIVMNIVVGYQIIGFGWINCDLVVIFYDYYFLDLVFVSCYRGILSEFEICDLWEVIFYFFDLVYIVFQCVNYGLVRYEES